MSSQDFFNQSFSPAPSSGNRRAPPPPPPPPPTSSASSGTGQDSSRSSTAPVSGNASKNNTTTGTTSSTRSGGGFYDSSGMIKKPIRPTGNYYATTSNTTDTNTPAPMFYSAGGNTNTSINTTMNSNPYATTDDSGADGSQDSDWFSASAQTTQAPNPYAYNASSTMTSESTSGNTVYNANNQNSSTVTADSSNGFGSGRSESLEMLSGPISSSSSSHDINNNTSSTPNISNNIFAFGSASQGQAQNNSSSAIPNTDNSSTMRPTTTYEEDYENEPPLLEELGINISHIQTKSLSVILPMKYAKAHIDSSIMEDTDLAGPLAFALLLGGELLLAAKMNFGYIYGLGLCGCFGMTLVLNLMSPSDSISIWTVVSILGYSLLPVNLLAGINVLYRIKYMGTLGVVLATLTIGWCTVSSTRLFERGCGLRDQRFLVGYPVALLYSAFVMMTIF